MRSTASRRGSTALSGVPGEWVVLGTEPPPGTEQPDAEQPDAEQPPDAERAPADRAAQPIGAGE